MTIEFLEDTHTYLADGVLIPSVSDLIRYRFPEAYKSIPSQILKKKASYGTKVHQMIEAFIKGEFTLDELKAMQIDPNIKIAVEQFEELRKKWCFYVKEMEQIVDFNGRYAGMFDLKCEDTIIDIKTTSELHEDWLACQLGLYCLASKMQPETCYCMWLPKGKAGKVVPIKPWTPSECLALIDSYEKDNSSK